MRSEHIFCVDLYFHNIGNIDNVDYGIKRLDDWIFRLAALIRMATILGSAMAGHVVVPQLAVVFAFREKRHLVEPST